ncbi:MAG: RNA polymerase sigma factor [Chloroflexi bacterium]|nr:RNA polymerase sigma factor [Chloroflexota bacterium]
MTGRPADSHKMLMEVLYSEHHRAILNYLYRMVGDAARAEDLAQEVFLRAFRALPKLPDAANYRAWLYRIATNAAYDALRRQRLLQWLSLRETDVDDSSSVRPEQVIQHELVQEALMKLPTTYRSPLVLFSVQGHTVREIAQMLGISEGAVKTRLSRARELFRKAYDHEA